MSDTFSVNDHRRPPFLWMDINVPRRFARKLGPGPLALYTILASYCNDSRQCWPSIDTLAADLGVTRNTLKAYKERLECVGLIRAQERIFRRPGKKWTGYLFTLLDLPGAKGVKNSPPWHGGQNFTDGGQKSPPEVDLREQDPEEGENPPLSPQGEAAAPPPADDHQRATSTLEDHQPPPDERQATTEQRRHPRTEAQRAEANAILRYLNQQTGHKWGERNLDAALRYILACVRKGATADEGRLVIDWCKIVKEAWSKDGFVDKYLNPVTPFRNTNFETYLGYAREWEAQGRPNPTRLPRIKDMPFNVHTQQKARAVGDVVSWQMAEWEREGLNHE